MAIRLSKQSAVVGIICLAIGAAIVLGIRYFRYKPESVHYHANFALYINGQQDQFKGPQFYEESAMCSVGTAAAMTPSERAHMHDNIHDVVHIEDHAVTWGQFFANLGWTLGDTFIASSDGTVYQQTGDVQLHLLMNGQDYTGLGGLANRVIRDQDKLLVSYSNESTGTLQREYNTIPSSAHHYDIASDPKSCSGHTSSVSVHDRLAHLL